MLYLNGSLRFFNVARAPALTWEPVPNVAAVIAPHLWLCALLSAGALAFELGFPLAIVLRRLRPWFLGAGVAFHLGNHVLLDLIFWPVLAVYPLVVPWSVLVAWAVDRAGGSR